MPRRIAQRAACILVRRGGALHTLRQGPWPHPGGAPDCYRGPVGWRSCSRSRRASVPARLCAQLFGLSDGQSGFGQVHARSRARLAWILILCRLTIHSSRRHFVARLNSSVRRQLATWFRVVAPRSAASRCCQCRVLRSGSHTRAGQVCRERLRTQTGRWSQTGSHRRALVAVASDGREQVHGRRAQVVRLRSRPGAKLAVLPFPS